MESKSKSILSEIVTSIAGLSAFSYVIGFVVVNSFLIDRGLVTHSALSSRFLAAGLCFILFYLLASSLLIIIPGSISIFKQWHTMKVERDKSLENKISHLISNLPDHLTESQKSAYVRGFKITFPLFFLIGYGFSFMLGLFISQLVYFIPYLFLVFILLFATGSDISLSVFVYMSFWSYIVMTSVLIIVDVKKTEIINIYAIVPWLMLLTLLAATMFGSNLYPRISALIGGGIPQKVMFVVDDGDKALVQKILGNKSINGNKLLALMYAETSDSYFVSDVNPSNNSMIQIKSDLIKGVVHNP